LGEREIEFVKKVAERIASTVLPQKLTLIDGKIL
jgi:hypothetical protein